MSSYEVTSMADRNAAGAEGQPDPSPRPGAPYHGDRDSNGVDLTLLRYMLGLSPLERLRFMERHARDTLVLYEYGRRHREATAPQDR